MRCVRFCSVQFHQRVELYHDKVSESSTPSRMLSLLDVESEVEYLLLVKQLEGRPWKSCFEVIRMLMANTQIAEPGLRHWAAHKSHPVIGSGLNQACSEISPEDWNLFCSHALETLDGEPSQWSQQSNSPKSHIKKRVGHNISRHMLTSPRRADYDLNLLSTDRTYLQMGIQQGHSDTSSNYESGRGRLQPTLNILDHF